jgi:hypothetical protein
VAKWSVHLLERLKKKFSVEVWEPYRTDLEQVAFRTLDKTQRALGKYNFIIDEQSIITLSFAYNVM